MSGLSLVNSSNGDNMSSSMNTAGSVGGVELSESGGRALKLQTDSPHLVSMGGDRLSTSVTLHPIPQGRITLGSGSGVDIPVQGTGVLPLHCHIENSEGIVTIYPLSENISIDGEQINGPTRLSQGVMLTIGRSNYLRFNHPAEAKLIKSVIPNPRISMAPIKFEPDNTFPTKFNKKPPAVPRKVVHEGSDDEPPSSIMMKVSKFEYLAAQNFKKSISPKVFSSNLVTVNTPAKDVLGKAPPDINSFTKNLPQSALNYSELNYNEKQQMKSERTMFGRKSPQYVNVQLCDKKNVNNRVLIYENGNIPKSQNVNIDHNELNNKNSSCNKNINMNKMSSSMTSFTQQYRSVTPSPVFNNRKMMDQRRSGSLGDLNEGHYDSEIRRNQAQQERIKEQEIEKAEQVRLDEILNMCADYEKQSQQCEKNKPTPNRIKTNGSLPRDKRQYSPTSPIYTTPPQSPLDMLHNEILKHSNHTYENVNVVLNTSRENCTENERVVNIEKSNNEVRISERNSPYENVVLQQNNTIAYPPSPRTRIKTFLSPNKDVPKETTELIENKFAILNTEEFLLLESELKQNLNNIKDFSSDSSSVLLDSPQRKSTPTKFILPLDDTTESKSSHAENKIENVINFDESYEKKKRLEDLKAQKKNILSVISKIKRQMSEIETQEEELLREVELEKALISGEHKSKLLDLEKLTTRKQKLLKRAQTIEDSMRDCQMKQEEDQKECKEKLKIAQENMFCVEEKLNKTTKPSTEYEAAFEEYLNAQEQLDIERKVFEDLEFHHLEEEANWLASKEELQREIIDLSKRIENLKEHIADLEQQKLNTSKNNTLEYKTIEKQKMECMVRLEEIRNQLKQIDFELLNYCHQESDQEVSSDSESDRSKELDKQLSDKWLGRFKDMSTSDIVTTHSKIQSEHVYNMSQSFNEKLLPEKSIVEIGIGDRRKFPSQDDIDRISKVTSNAPINLGDGEGSLGRKTLESLREIERNRQLHLHQQGSQVIEQERQRLLALKHKAQQEVKTKWAQQRQECTSFGSSGSEDIRNSNVNEELSQCGSQISSHNKEEGDRESIVKSDSSRPLSQTSEMSVETESGTLNRKRNKPPVDKQRPLTRYLPIRSESLNLRQHIESAGHQVVLCPHVLIDVSTCKGFLHKKGSKLNGWSRRWFVFDRNKHTLTYYSDKSEKKARGGAYFQAIEEVYLDHLNNVKSPNPHLTFIVKTHERSYYLMAPSPEAMRIWVDVIFTGAEGYREYEHDP